MIDPKVVRDGSPLRRRRLASLVLLLVMTASSSIAPAAAAVETSAGDPEMFVYFGTRKSGPGLGLSLARFDPATGSLSPPRLLVEDEAASFLLLHPGGTHLYVCNAVGEFQGEPAGSVASYAIERATGALRLLNKQSTGGPGPCFISADATGRFLLGANYRGSSVFTIAINPDGSLGPRTASIVHEGHTGVVPDRQEAAHPHSMRVDPTNRFALAPDLGLDQVVIYRFDARTGALTPNDPPFARLAPGAGPRHLSWHPNGRYVYVVNELGGAVTAFRWDAGRGALTEVHTVPTLPADFTGENLCAEIAVRADGRFVYATNRGHDSITIFAIDASSGRMSFVDRVPSGGRKPRYFEIDPTSNWAIATNYETDTAAVFRIDRDSGRLVPVAGPVIAPHPYGVCFLPSPP